MLLTIADAVNAQAVARMSSLMQIAEAFDGAVYIFLVVVRNPSGTRQGRSKNG